MDNAIKTVAVTAVSLVNFWLVYLLASGLANRAAQWDLELSVWLWKAGVPVVLVSLVVLIISAAQKTRIRKWWLITWVVNLSVPFVVFGVA